MSHCCTLNTWIITYLCNRYSSSEKSLKMMLNELHWSLNLYACKLIDTRKYSFKVCITVQGSHFWRIICRFGEFSPPLERLKNFSGNFQKLVEFMKFFISLYLRVYFFHNVKFKILISYNFIIFLSKKFEKRSLTTPPSSLCPPHREFRIHNFYYFFSKYYVFGQFILNVPHRLVLILSSFRK